ncbi:GTP pyrophosphokinase [Hydrogenophaga sp. R2]|uniref:GTP pyrophosphokinase n=1 Tax=Hydrogenophaga sp. R2 TaxID=3132827 RepID=UPI003CEFCDB9
MSNRTDFIDWLDEVEPALKAWGGFVVAKLTELVELEIGQEQFKSFFKVKPGFRVKDKQSAINKQNLKQYADPKEQMTDLVGARFVVLLKLDLEVVEKVLIEYPGWTRSKDRDPLGEQRDKPKHFDYQSVHYVVRAADDMVVDGVHVPAGMPCEVQIRTLLQHAYAELVHDKFYKGVGHIPPSADRLVARSMALMESTDDMFVQAVRELEAVNKSRDQWCAMLDAAVGPLIPGHTPTAQDHDALEILEEFRDLLQTANIEAVKVMLVTPVIAKIKAGQSQGNLYAKPIVLLVYWLLAEHPFLVGARWPVPALRSGFDQVRTHMGISSR